VVPVYLSTTSTIHSAIFPLPRISRTCRTCRQMHEILKYSNEQQHTLKAACSQSYRMKGMCVQYMMSP
jgi:hypothetical protein